MKVLLDTNILLGIFEHHTDYLSLIEKEFGVDSPLVLSTIIEELEKKEKNGALAITLLEKRNITIEQYTGSLKGDNSLLDYCEQQKDQYMLATHDRELQNRAKEKGIKLVSFRQKGYVKK